jgi:hypothetical protein
MALNTTISLAVAAAQTAARDLTTVRVPLNYGKTNRLASGTGANQADLMFSDTRTLAASGSESLDLAGVLTDALGATLTFARVKAIVIAASAGNTNDVVIGGAASNAFVNWVADATDKIKVKPGGMFVLVAPGAVGYPVTASTGDLLQVANSSSGTSVTYDVVIIGASA